MKTNTENERLAVMEDSARWLIEQVLRAEFGMRRGKARRARLLELRGRGQALSRELDRDFPGHRVYMRGGS